MVYFNERAIQTKMFDTWLSATDSLFNHFSGMYRGKKWRKQNKNAQFPSRAINAVFILISCVRCSQTSTTKNSLMMTHEYNKITHNGTNTTLNETWTSLEFTSKQGSDKGLPKKSTALHQGHSATTTGYTFKHKWLNSQFFFLLFFKNDFCRSPSLQCMGPYLIKRQWNLRESVDIYYRPVNQ